MVAILIALTAFFVASEFAIVKIRSTRIDQLVAEGNKNAIAAKTVISNLDEYLSACQLGITVTALGLGFLGESTVESLLHPLFELLDLDESFSTILSVAFAFLIITFLHVVVGELAPKTVAIQKAEGISLLVARPLILFYKIMFPFIWVLNGSARLLTGMFGMKRISEHDLAHTEEELRLILSESYKNGEINQSEYKYVNNIFEFDDRVAKEIMVPRTEIIALDKDKSVEEILTIMTSEKYTRYPVVDGDKDHIVGLINLKEVLTDFVTGTNSSGKTIEDYTRPIIQVIESIAIHDLLVKMQKERVHMAILIDEYGGTAGLVTVEDIIEEIVGEIRDEFDGDEQPAIRKVNDTTTILDGKVLIGEVNDLFGLNIDDTDVDTISGWILTEQIDVNQGDTISFDGYDFRIIEMDGHHIKSLEIKKTVPKPVFALGQSASAME
ncbi:hemolysin family protein [Ferdinandcohnia quinoae]|uniref:Hemolysin family protein n=1 Tax=Fredinandcohnia quinoae TaxID=2918902 RepID=A0AAW5E450_9BACI|nr:hemolysin family protein [Fredinandcohnia sp. SECRCQ15]MCH1627263.1 hemolysin family protein [Fredinandcohnia sp. SECRCQ15]